MHIGCRQPTSRHIDDNLPVDDLFILSSDEVLLVWGDDAQGVLLARLGLRIYDVSAQVHVDRALRQRAWLEGTQKDTLVCIAALKCKNVWKKNNKKEDKRGKNADVMLESLVCLDVKL